MFWKALKKVQFWNNCKRKLDFHLSDQSCIDCLHFLYDPQLWKQVVMVVNRQCTKNESLYFLALCRRLMWNPDLAEVTFSHLEQPGDQEGNVCVTSMFCSAITLQFSQSRKRKPEGKLLMLYSKNSSWPGVNIQQKRDHLYLPSSCTQLLNAKTETHSRNFISRRY